MSIASTTTLDRRRAMSTIAAIAASAATPALSSDLASPYAPEDADLGRAWAMAKDALAAARAQELAFDQQSFLPAVELSNAGGAPVPKHIGDEADRLTDLRCNAEEALIMTPAPDVSAVIDKLDLGRRARPAPWEYFPEDWLIVITDDLRRLAQDKGHVAQTART